MKILMITPYLPYPLVSGGQIRTYNLLKHLAKKHQITLVSFIRQPAERENIPKLFNFCKKVEVVLRRKAWSPINIFLAGLSHLPFLISIYYSKTAKKIISELLKSARFDLIHAETFYVMPNIPKTEVPILLVEQTIEYLVYDHFVKSAKAAVIKPLLAYDVFKIKLWERHFWQKADKVVAMSAADAKVMRQLVPGLNVEIVPNGIDSQFFARAKKISHTKPTVLFVGNFAWLQNREAVEFLVKLIWPKIITAIPVAQLLIVGRDPSLSIRNLAKNSQIIVDDSVEDIRTAYSSSDVLLAPIFGPGGTRFKILESFAASVPVVTTATGIEGIPATDGRQVIIGEDPDQLAAATVRLLKDKNFHHKISEGGKKLVQEKFEWSKIAQNLDKIYLKVGHGKKH